MSSPNVLRAQRWAAREECEDCLTSLCQDLIEQDAYRGFLRKLQQRPDAQATQIASDFDLPPEVVREELLSVLADRLSATTG